MLRGVRFAAFKMRRTAYMAGIFANGAHGDALYSDRYRGRFKLISVGLAFARSNEFNVLGTRIVATTVDHSPNRDSCSSRPDCRQELPFLCCCLCFFDG